MEITNSLLPSTCAVSVIMPMYNVEKYISESLDSLLNQTFKDFEVIVINDCSTDNSRQIAESYLEKFGGRLKIFDNEKNSGAGASRNNGLLKASGEYVFNMDSDDSILLTALEKLYKVAKEYNADVVNGLGFYITSEDSKEITRIISNKRVLTNENDIQIDEDLSWRLEKPLTYRYYGSPCLRLSRRDFLLENKIFFPENVKRGEDIVWKHGFLLCAKRIVHVPFIFYFYRMSETSLSRRKRNIYEIINSRMTTIIDGIKWIDDIMNKVKFFDQNPQYRYKILEDFTANIFKRLFMYTKKNKCSTNEFYNTVREEFGEKLGKYDVLVAELCALLDAQKRQHYTLSEKVKAANLQTDKE